MGMKRLFETPNAASIISYKVADIQAAFQSLSSSLAPLEGEPHLIVRMPDHDLWMGFFRDSEGNQRALMSEVPRG
jgi:methylmalonyl-CoA/ethylmalonyl-CoA epimerase